MRRIWCLQSAGPRPGGRIGRGVTIGQHGAATVVGLLCLLIWQVQIVVAGAQRGYGLVLLDCS